MGNLMIRLLLRFIEKKVKYKICMSLIYQMLICQDLINCKIVKSLLEKVLENVWRNAQSQNKRNVSRNAIIFWCQSFQRKLPFTNKFLASLGCLNPQKIASSKPSDIELLAKKLFVSYYIILKVTDEWKVLSIDQSIHSLSYERVDNFWREVFSQITSNDTRKYPTVTDVLKMALSLSHGNVDVERGLSVNNSIVTKERNQ